MIELDADRRLPVSAAQESMDGRLLILYPFCVISVRRTVRADDGVLRDAGFRCIFAIPIVAPSTSSPNASLSA